MCIGNGAAGLKQHPGEKKEKKRKEKKRKTCVILNFGKSKVSRLKSSSEET